MIRGHQKLLFWQLSKRHPWVYWNDKTVMQLRPPKRKAKAALLHRVKQVDTMNDLP